MHRLLGVGFLVVVGGCVPGKEAQSAGQVGCTPEEISISQEHSHFGLLQTTETWVAECQGRKFVCSQINQSGNDQSLFHTTLASEQVSCREAAESPDVARRRTEEASPAERTARVPSAPPTGAAGFAFGETPDAVVRRCTDAGQTWRNAGSDEAAGKSGCSGPAAPLGIEASVDVRFCAGRACLIAVDHVPPANWSRSAVALKANLETKYGPASDSSGNVPEQCRGEEAFARCLEARLVDLHYRWAWAGGESIEMTVGKTQGNDHAAIRLVYRRTAGANLSAL